MGQSTRTWTWIIIVAAILLFLSFLFFRNSASPTVSYDPNDPNVIGITEGTEGSFEELEIGILFVESGGVGLSIYSTGTETFAPDPADGMMEVGDTIIFAGYRIELVDAQVSASNAVFQVHPIE